MFARCQYGQVGESLKQLASVCSGLSSPNGRKSSTQPRKLRNNMTAFNGTHMTLGNAGDTNLQPDENSTDGDALTASTPRSSGSPPTTKLSPLRQHGTVVSSSINNSGQPSSHLAPPSPRMSRGRRGYFAGCGMLEQGSQHNDVLVGMLLGECIQVSLWYRPTAPTDGVKACLKTKPDRAINADYTQDIFVKRTKVPASKSTRRCPPLPSSALAPRFALKSPRLDPSSVPRGLRQTGQPQPPTSARTSAPSSASSAPQSWRHRNYPQQEQRIGRTGRPAPRFGPGVRSVVLAVMCLFICGCCAGCRWFRV